MSVASSDAGDRTRSGIREIGKTMARPFKTLSKVLIRELSFITNRSQSRSTESTTTQPQPTQPPHCQGPSEHVPEDMPVDTNEAESEIDAHVSQENDDAEAEDGTPGVIPAGLHSARSSLPNGARPPTPPLQGRIDVGPSRKARGNGVFSKIRLPRDDVVLHENPLLRCNFHQYRFHSECTVVDNWQKLDNLSKDQLKRYFGQLNMLPSTRLNKRQRRRIQAFAGKYGFRQDNNTHRSDLLLVYLMPGLINHACREHANCTFTVHHLEPYAITVTLTRDVDVNEELLITYNEKELYQCMDCCGHRTQKARRTMFGVMADLRECWTRLNGLFRSGAAPDSRSNDRTKLPQPDRAQQPGSEQQISQTPTPRASTHRYVTEAEGASCDALEARRLEEVAQSPAEGTTGLTRQ